MINENRIGMAQNPWPVVVPVLLIGLLTIGMNLFTDALGRAALARHDGSREAAEETVPTPSFGPAA
jgi:peptide/nickel transport system permease protein